MWGCIDVKPERINFDIVPIFNQSANQMIWHDFADIEMACDIILYNYNYDDSDKKRIIDSHKYEWKHCKYNFAFGAFHNDKMIGFINGFSSDSSDMFLRNLYVLPQYNGMGIGGMLLRCAEKTSYLVANNMDVRALAGAVSFYEKNGFTNYDGRSLSKELNQSRVDVIPVFEWKKLMHVKLGFNIDKELLKQNKYQPKFVYVGPNREVEAVGVKTVDNENVIWVNPKKLGMADFYQKILLRELSKSK